MVYEPWDALKAPRFTGPRTYARLPYVNDLDGVEAAVYGVPWDGGASFRGGARFGPEGVRSASAMIRTYNPVQRVQVFGVLSTIDYGDAPTAPGYLEETLRRVQEFAQPIAESGAVPVAIGGDHSITLAELRALAAVHGPLGLVHLDSHTDLWDSYYDGIRYGHGTLFRRAIEEGCSSRRGCYRRACAAHCTASPTRASRTSSGSSRSLGWSSRGSPRTSSRAELVRDSGRAPRS
jgi:agmatinase